jgi:hypothetical protein
MIRSNQTPVCYSVDIETIFPLSTQMKLGQYNINISLHQLLQFITFIVTGSIETLTIIATVLCFGTVIVT